MWAGRSWRKKEEQTGSEVLAQQCSQLQTHTHTQNHRWVHSGSSGSVHHGSSPISTGLCSIGELWVRFDWTKGDAHHLLDWLLTWEESVTVQPAAFDRLQTPTGVTSDKMLGQMFWNAENQGAALPLDKGRTDVRTWKNMDRTMKDVCPHPAAVVFPQVQLDWLDTAIITARVHLHHNDRLVQVHHSPTLKYKDVQHTYYTPVDGQTQRHVTVTTVHLQAVTGLMEGGK